MMQCISRNLAAVLAATSFVVTLSARYSRGDDSLRPPTLRLPADAATPVRYRAELTVIPDQDTFTGSIEIDLRFAKSTPILWLNADKITVKGATLTAGGEKFEAKVVAEPKDFVGFAFPRPVDPGEATLRVVYQGEMNRKDGQGIFQRKDNERWYVYTQFEETSARQAFPCFDEPGYKVPWQVTLQVKKDQVALSNTPVSSETDTHDGMKTVRFAETKPLPSYLIAFSVGDFELVAAGTAGKNKTPVRIAVPRGHTDEAVYAAQTTPAIVEHLENYFGIPYPYEKLDEVAVPLFGGAMENAGQVTYGFSIILGKGDQITPQWQRTWTWVAAHELAHQWSGDLVTTAWWDDIWLNEGFANWAADKIVSEYRPEWKSMIGVANSTQSTMVSDSLVSARRVRQPIDSADDIANAFDSITYDKGDALLSMFEAYLGPDRFEQGVSRYLTKYSYKNATSADFLRAISGDDPAVTPAFATFLDQPGVPLITINLNCSRKPSEHPASVDISQQRFLPIGSTASAQLWHVPVCMRYPSASGVERQCLLLDQPSRSVALDRANSCPDWLEANADADGYYRVLYQGDLFGNLLRDNASVLSPREKVALVGDMSALTRAGKLPLGTALALAPNLARDPSRRVVFATMEITTDPKDTMVPADRQSQFRLYLEDVYGQRARQLGWKAQPGESDDDHLLRPRLLDVVANEAEDSELIAQAKSLALAWLDDRDVVDRDVVGTLLSTAARHGDQALFDRFRAASRQEKDEDTQQRLLGALGLFPQPEIARTAFKIVLSDDFPPQQSISILASARESSMNRDLAYDFVKQNWDALIAKFPPDWGAFMPFMAAAYCDEQHRHDAADFFEGRSTKYKGGPRSLAQTLEAIDLCIAFKKTQQPSLVQFLGQYKKGELALSGP